VHTNGFSLVRRVFGTDEDPSALFRPWPGLERNLGDELMVRHRGYYPMLAPHLVSIKALSHITGGGLPGNLVRILPSNCSAIIRKGTWEIPPIFGFLQDRGHVESDEMYRVFNMGIGLVLVVSRDQVEAAVDVLTASGESALRIGEIVDGNGEVQLVEAG